MGIIQIHKKCNLFFCNQNIELVSETTTHEMGKNGALLVIGLKF
jgi:hypothetical protein